MAIVSQEPKLFSGTIAENISLGASSTGREATQREIEEAARMANAHDFIMDFKDGYQTDVGFGGSQLSGGQKQRIAIARALVKNPQVLLLDEATSALDNKSEQVVQEALDRLLHTGKNRTTIVIAHRLSTIRTADVICYVKEGEVVERGSHRELMGLEGGHYRALVEEQELVGKDDERMFLGRVSWRSFSRRGFGGQRTAENDFVSKFFGRKDLGGLLGAGVEPFDGLERDNSLEDNLARLYTAERLGASRDKSELSALPQSLERTLDFLQEFPDGAHPPGKTHKENDMMLLKPLDSKMGWHSAMYTLRSMGHIPTLKIEKLPSESRDGAGSLSKGPWKSTLGRKVTLQSPSSFAMLQAESDEEWSPVRWSRIIDLNRPELGYLVLGTICGAVTGATYPLWGFVFASMIQTFFTPVLKCSDPGGELVGGLPPTLIPQELGGPYQSCQEYWESAGLKVWGVVVKTSYAWIALAVTSFLGSTGMFYGFGAASENLAYRVRNLMFSAYLRQEPGYFDLPENAVGSVSSKLASDATRLKAKTGEPLQQIVITAFGLILGVVLSFIFMWPVALMALGVLPFLGFAMALQTSYMFEDGDPGRQGGGALGALVGESLTAMRTVAALSLEPSFVKRHDALMANSNSILSLLKKGLLYGASFALQMWTFALLLWFGGWCVANLNFAYKNFAVALLSFFFGLFGLSLAASGLTDSKEAVEALRNIFAVLDRETKIDPEAETGNTPGAEKVDGEIYLRKIQFAYPARPDVVVCKSLTFKVKAGQKVGLVGPSGSGKSTVIQLIERFYDPDVGNTIFDKKDVKKLNYRWLHNQMALVGQEPMLFQGTIFDNIALGYNNSKEASGDCTMERIVEAATLANAHDFIMDLPHGYDTELGQGGTLLSGGQKQRIAIARALIQKPKVLLLDEATSALDNKSEAVVQRTLDRLIAESKLTTVMIAHRLSTVRNMDVIVVVDEGKVVEAGSHDELMRLKGLYHALTKSSEERRDGVGPR
ncbi:ABC transporter [Chloropicon roscoffensis]|uniref:ABC transporter n=1 Tax=Chloropicon roscoffensis TaxID=1461544 RepID=A0AAX4P1Z4_9CHLO